MILKDHQKQVTIPCLSIVLESKTSICFPSAKSIASSPSLLTASSLAPFSIRYLSNMETDSQHSTLFIVTRYRGFCIDSHKKETDFKLY